MDTSRWLAHLALFTVALIYGANYTIAKEVMQSDGITSDGFIWFRVLTGTIIFGALYLGTGRESIDRGDWKWLILCGLFGAAINQIFFFRGLRLTGPIHASLIMTTTPILVLMISSIWLGEKITLRKIIGVLVGGSGAVLLITYGETVSFQSDQLLGDLQILINATSYGIYLVIVKSLMARYQSFTVLFWLFFFGLLFVSPVGMSDALHTDWSSFTSGVWLGFVYVMVGTTCLAYLLNIYGLRRLQASVVSTYIYLQPLLASLIALFLGKDEGTVLKLVAAVAIFVGVFLVSDVGVGKKYGSDVTD